MREETTQSQPWVREIYHALVYTGSKWRPWLWWSITGAAAGTIGGAASTFVVTNLIWGLPLTLVLFIGLTKIYGLLEREYTAKSIQSLFLFPAALCIAFAVTLPVHGLFFRALVLCGAGALGGLNALFLANRARRIDLCIASGVASGAIAALAGLLIHRVVNGTLSELQSNAAAGTFAGFTYCAMLSGVFLVVLWDPSCIFAQLAKKFEEAERLPDAIIMCDLAISIRPDDYVFFYNRGTFHVRLGQYDEAFNDFDRALSLNPNDSGSYSNRGSAYLEVPTVIKLLRSGRTTRQLTVTVVSVTPRSEMRSAPPKTSAEPWNCLALPTYATRL